MATAGNSGRKAGKATGARATSGIPRSAPTGTQRTKRKAGTASKSKPQGPIAVIEARAAGVVGEAVETIKAAAGRVAEASPLPEGTRAVVSAVRERAKKSVTAVRRRPSPKPARAGSKGTSTGALVGIAAAGLAAGVIANLGRKAAVQAPSVMAGDWFEALKVEHKAALALLDKLAASKPTQPAKRGMLLTQLKHALGKHAFTEENVIYPALREWGDKADADALAHEQSYHKQFLYELDGMDKTSPDFSAKVADFRNDLQDHILEEENKIFPQLKKGLSAEKNKELTALANREGFKVA